MFPRFAIKLNEREHNSLKLNVRITVNKIFRKNYFKTNVLLRTRNYNFYEILGVERESTNDQIKQAYLKLAKQYHPDINKDPGSDDKFKTIALAYEALSNQRNRDLYDAYMENDPYSQDFNFWKDEENFAKQEKARHDKHAGGFYKNSHESNFWRGEREDFEEKFYKDYENIFNSGFKQSKSQKGDDILLEILITFFDSYNGSTKGVKFTRKEKCHSCHGLRSATGTRPSKCFSCNATGEIKTGNFSSKKCNQCKGVGYIIKSPCNECNAEGYKTYEVNEAIEIPKGIKSNTNLRYEKKGNCSQNKDTINGDLIIKIMVEDDKDYKRVNDDLVSNLELNLKDAIMGTNIQITSYDGMLKNIYIKPGTQTDQKIVFKELGFINQDNLKQRGDQVLFVRVKIPSIFDFSRDDQNSVINLLEKLN